MKIWKARGEGWDGLGKYSQQRWKQEGASSFLQGRESGSAVRNEAASAGAPN